MRIEIFENFLLSVYFQCQEQLFKREKLVVKDTEVSKGLVRACRADIKLYKCKRSTSDHRKVRLAQMLLCLENAAHNGTQIDAFFLINISENAHSEKYFYR